MLICWNAYKIISRRRMQMGNKLGNLNSRPSSSSGPRTRRATAAAALVGYEGLSSLQGETARAVGCLLGVMCGDVLGAAVEGKTAEKIVELYPDGVRFYDVDTERGFGMYTDDTQMTIALAQHLIDHGQVDRIRVAHAYARLFDRRRGYGATAQKILAAIVRGADPRKTGNLFIAEGSFANGGAMRVAPIGIAYRHASARVLRRAVEAALMCTHTHPIGIDGAVVQAAAVAYLINQGSEPRESVEDKVKGMLEFLTYLQRHAATADMQQHLSWLHKRVEGWDQGHVPDLQADLDLRTRVWQDELAFIQDLCPDFQIAAHDAVACALCALLHHWDNPEAAVIAAVHYGGDTDTIGSMAGALAGAKCGLAWFPSRWLEEAENGEHGRDEIITLGQSLIQLDVTA